MVTKTVEIIIYYSLVYWKIFIEQSILPKNIPCKINHRTYVSLMSLSGTARIKLLGTCIM